MTHLRPYQERGLEAALLASSAPGRALWCAPTGTGKGTLQLAVLAALRAAGRTAVLTTPSGEIARWLIERVGLVSRDTALSEGELWRRVEGGGIYTPVRLRNRIAAGLAPPAVVLVDEAHHATASSVAVMEALASQIPCWLGWTATPYRGTHAETQALRAWWGEPRVLLSIADAVAERYLSVPRPEVWPLLDDRGIEVRGTGEYDESATTAAVVAQGTDAMLVARLQEEGWVTTDPSDSGDSWGDPRWIRPTLIAVSTAEHRAALVAALSDAGMPAAEISGETPRAERDALLARCRVGEVALVQIQVLAEGVDMPWLRRLIDLRPRRSPVSWMQLVGRITRPTQDGEPAPEYVCGCRNLERHGYLWRDVWPSRAVAVASQIAWDTEDDGGDEDDFAGGFEDEGEDSALDRGLARDVLARKRRVKVPLLGGGHAVAVTCCRQVPGSWDTEEHILALAVPGEEHPRVFRRLVVTGEKWRWGDWQRASLDTAGYAGWSRPRKAGEALSAGQLAWWREDAARLGLDPAAADALTRYQFAVLPALANTGTSLAQSSCFRGGAAESSPPAPPLLAPPATPAAPATGPAPATWLSLDGGGWGAEVLGDAARTLQAGDVLRVRARDGRETIRRVARVVARRERWALCEV